MHLLRVDASGFNATSDSVISAWTVSRTGKCSVLVGNAMQRK